MPRRLTTREELKRDNRQRRADARGGKRNQLVARFVPALLCSSAIRRHRTPSPDGLRLCSMCLRPLVHGNRLHPQPAAFTAQHRCSAHQPCQASLPLQCFARLGTATTRIRCWLLSLQGSSLHAQPAAPSVHAIIQRCIPLFGLHLRNMPDRQPPEHSN